MEYHTLPPVWFSLLACQLTQGHRNFQDNLVTATFVTTAIRISSANCTPLYSERMHKDALASFTQRAFSDILCV